MQSVSKNAFFHSFPSCKKMQVISRYSDNYNIVPNRSVLLSQCKQNRVSLDQPEGKTMPVKQDLFIKLFAFSLNKIFNIFKYFAFLFSFSCGKSCVNHFSFPHCLPFLSKWLALALALRRQNQ